MDEDRQNSGKGDDMEPKSSRFMPVPEHMLSRSHHSSRENVDDAVVPPPSYTEVVVNRNKYEEPPPETEDVPMADMGEGAEGSELSPEEIAVIMQMRDSRSSYVDGAGREEEAFEMGTPGNWTLRESSVDKQVAGDLGTVGMESQGVARISSVVDAEEGNAGSHREDEETPRILRLCRGMAATQIICFVVVAILIIGVLLFLSLFPASFVYVDYDKIALKQSKMTNVVDMDEVFYGGCYVLGPDTKFVYFKSTTHDVVHRIAVFTKDTISVTINFSLHYFIRPKEVGLLFRKFVHDYNPPFELMIKSTIKNIAAAELSVNNFRFNRTYVETRMHAAIRRKLGGDCCPDCCKSRECQSNTYCETCNPLASCNQGYHVDARFFNLLGVSIPNEVFERYLHIAILEVQKEREFFFRNHTLTVKETERQTKNITNRAKEKLDQGHAEANRIRTVANADKEVIVTNAQVSALKDMYTYLNITRQDYKASVLLVRSLEDSASNLYAGYGFNKNTLYSP
ncbi:uncharacterized protein LOC128227267 isoform X2 [Mya arenaria]|uniref:uncharacterized protein LOC128227267 isoform X2 n=1 Tax=Mya arenaria TaxID=6604 RepID=UPI0022E0BAE5|nr:uncharacterized protein LOC128227267 isoform X2 [Mya arenaria]